MGWRQMTADAVIYGAGVQGMAAAAKFLAEDKPAVKDGGKHGRGGAIQTK